MPCPQPVHEPHRALDPTHPATQLPWQPRSEQMGSPGEFRVDAHVPSSRRRRRRRRTTTPACCGGDDAHDQRVERRQDGVVVAPSGFHVDGARV